MPPLEATPKKRGRRPKADVQEEFENLVAESQSQREGSTSKLEELRKIQEQSTRDAVQDVTAEGIVRRLADLNIDISKALSGISDKMMIEVKSLSRLHEAIAIEAEELRRLHKLDIAQTALDQLIEEYQKQEQELSTSIEEQRSQWQEEIQSRDAEIERNEEELARTRKRENEEFEYKKALERKKAQDKYEEELRLRDKQNREKQEALEASWRQREAALKMQEDEVAGLRKTVGEFPDKLAKQLDTTVAEAVRQTEQRLSQELVLLRRDTDAERRLAEFKVAGLEEIIAQQQKQIAALQAQVEEAKRQVQDIALKAIEGASGSRALSHINQIAMEQAKHRPAG